MGAFIVLAFIGISAVAGIAGSWNDQRLTHEDRDRAKADGRLTYHQYFNNGKNKRSIYAPTGTKGYELGGKFYDTRGRLVADISKMQVDRANEVSMMLAKQKGWSFYPYFREITITSPVQEYARSSTCHPCKEFSTGTIFQWKMWKLASNYKRSPVTNEYRKIPVSYNQSGRYWKWDMDRMSGPTMITEQYTYTFLREIKDVAQKAWEAGFAIRA